MIYKHDIVEVGVTTAMAYIAQSLNSMLHIYNSDSCTNTKTNKNELLLEAPSKIIKRFETARSGIVNISDAREHGNNGFGLCTNLPEMSRRKSPSVFTKQEAMLKMVASWK